jgi:hypothetical protein
MEFNDTFREVISKTTTERMKNYTPGDADRKFARQLGRGDLTGVKDWNHQDWIAEPKIDGLPYSVVVISSVATQGVAFGHSAMSPDY